MKVKIKGTDHQLLLYIIHQANLIWRVKNTPKKYCQLEQNVIIQKPLHGLPCA